MTHTTTSRRSFLKTSAAVTGGLMLGFNLPGTPGEAMAAGTVYTPNAWVHIADNNAITIEFKEFGVGLSFTPTVIGKDLINMIVAPEVSRIDPTVSVSTINDTVVEGSEDYTVTIDSPTAGSVATSQANTVITDDGDSSLLSWTIVGSSTVTEGNAANYTVSYTGATLAPGQTMTIAVASNGGYDSSLSDAQAQFIEIVRRPPGKTEPFQPARLPLPAQGTRACRRGCRGAWGESVEVEVDTVGAGDGPPGGRADHPVLDRHRREDAGPHSRDRPQPDHAGPVPCIRLLGPRLGAHGARRATGGPGHDGRRLAL